jgi:hypothetical protein
MQYNIPLCASCAHEIIDAEPGFKCAAFPEGIPGEILRGEFDHHNPYPDDNGIQYEEEI